jgi:hypothetical protein
MEFVGSTEVPIPVMQILLLLLITTSLFLFGKIKIALLTNYLFAFYWCFKVTFEGPSLINPGASSLFFYLYLAFGAVLVILALIGFIYKSRV